MSSRPKHLERDISDLRRLIRLVEARRRGLTNGDSRAASADAVLRKLRESLATVQPLRDRPANGRV